TPPTLPSTLSLHDALPISAVDVAVGQPGRIRVLRRQRVVRIEAERDSDLAGRVRRDAAVREQQMVEDGRLAEQVAGDPRRVQARSEEHTSELQSPYDLVCR